MKMNSELGQTKIHQVDVVLFVFYYNYMLIVGYSFFLPWLFRGWIMSTSTYNIYFSQGANHDQSKHLQSANIWFNYTPAVLEVLLKRTAHRSAGWLMYRDAGICCIGQKSCYCSRVPNTDAKNSEFLHLVSSLQFNKEDMFSNKKWQLSLSHIIWRTSCTEALCFVSKFSFPRKWTNVSRGC